MCIDDSAVPTSLGRGQTSHAADTPASHSHSSGKRMVQRVALVQHQGIRPSKQRSLFFFSDFSIVAGLGVGGCRRSLPSLMHAMTSGAKARSSCLQWNQHVVDTPSAPRSSATAYGFASHVHASSCGALRTNVVVLEEQTGWRDFSLKLFESERQTRQRHYHICFVMTTGRSSSE